MYRAEYAFPATSKSAAPTLARLPPKRIPYKRPVLRCAASRRRRRYLRGRRVLPPHNWRFMRRSRCRPAYAHPSQTFAQSNMIPSAAVVDAPIAMNASPILMASAPPMRVNVNHKLAYPLNVNSRFPSAQTC